MHIIDYILSMSAEEAVETIEKEIINYEQQIKCIIIRLSRFLSQVTK